MGGGQSGGAKRVSTTAQKSINKSIEDKIMAQLNTDKRVVKIILLGAGECGKSTILKQMKILHMNGFTDEEIEDGRKLVFKNTLDSIQSLAAACKDLQIPYADPAACAPVAERLLKIDSSAEIDPLAIKADIILLWADEGCKGAKKRENEFHLLDSAPYFLNKVEEYFKPDFVPTTQDMLRTRLTTTGIIETQFTLEKMDFKMFDVGGQRGERKKWIHCFDDVTAIMFIASLSEYNQVLAEDREKNRLEESLDLFENIVNLPWFDKAKIILFLNKNDLFEEKIKKVALSEYHPEFKENFGGTDLDYDSGLAYIKEEYMDRNDDEDKTVYCHVTDATNTENVAFVWKATKHIIVENKLDGAGL